MANKISVIIPTYNNEKYISKAIDSVLSQTYQNFSIIVIDDGSTDNTKQILTRYQEKITYIYQENQGVSVARNTGIHNSNSDYIAFLDSDDEWLPRKLEMQVGILDKKKNIGLVHSNDIRISEDGKILYIDKPKAKYLNGKISKYLLLRKASIKTSTVLLRSTCLKKVGLFDTNLSKIGVEDRDLWIRFTKHFNAYYVDEPLVKFRICSNSMSHNREKMVKGRYYVVDKYYPQKRLFNIFRRRILSAIHYEMAKSLSWKGYTRESLLEYWNAYKYFPFSIMIYLQIIKTFFKHFFLWIR